MRDVKVKASDSATEQTSEYTLAQVLCHYRSPRRSTESVVYSVDDIMMLHGVDKGVVGPGQPIDPAEFARSIYRLKKGELVQKLELVGEHVLAMNRDNMLWWRPATPAKLWFKTAEPVPRLTALNGRAVIQPALVFRASRRVASLDVWALADNKRPTADTPLLCAPYMNLMGGGYEVCLGMARDTGLKVNRGSTPENWEHYFFDSNFSHTPPRLKHGKEETKDEGLKRYIEYLEAVAQSRRPFKVFNEWLRPFGRTLGSIL